MGGCRCSYRNCTSKSDGKTHLFHYPVFDRVRCHQWLLNADRLDLMDLKVAQLKNRVICQHHFRDKCFMNYMRDKLRHDAVPTEDGPNCDNRRWLSSKLKQQDTKLYAITREDIDELPSLDKETNSAMKYVDFLTNGELVELDYLAPNETPKEYTVIVGNDNELLPLQKMATSPVKNNKNLVKDKMDTVEIEIPPITSEINSKKHCGTLINTQMLHNESLNTQDLHGDKDVKISLSKVNPQDIHRKKIHIISEKKISDPVYVKGELRPLSPSLVLNIPSKKNGQNLFEHATISNSAGNSEILLTILGNSVTEVLKSQASIENLNIDKNVTYSTQIEPNQEKGLNVFEYEVTPNLRCGTETSVIVNNTFQPGTVHVESQSNPAVTTNPQRHKNKKPKPKQKSENLVSILNRSTVEDFKPEIHIEDVGEKNKKKEATPKKIFSNQKKHLNLNLSPRNSLLKKPISPERIAAIEEKRKFNKKLRDIIEAGLNNPEVNQNEELLKKEETKNQTVVSYLSKDREPTFQEYSFASLESRIKRMEDTLLSKIEQNSKRIFDLGKRLSPGPSDKKSTSFTQTESDEEAYKKQLFNEISKYLSSDTSSTVYEELFLNKFSCNSEVKNSQSSKRRRRR